MASLLHIAQRSLNGISSCESELRENAVSCILPGNGARLNVTYLAISMRPDDGSRAAMFKAVRQQICGRAKGGFKIMMER